MIKYHSSRVHFLLLLCVFSFKGNFIILEIRFFRWFKDNDNHINFLQFALCVQMSSYFRAILSEQAFPV